MIPRGYFPKVVLSEITKVNDDGKQQTVTHHGLAGEQHSDVYRPQYFGLSSHPPKGSTGITISLGGERSRSILFGGEHDEHRPTKLKEGELKLYDAEKNTIYLERKKGITVTASEGDTKIDTPKGKVTFTQKGDTKIETNEGTIVLTAKGDVFVHSEGKVYLGSKDGSGASRVSTEAGLSNKVFAVI